MTMKKTLRVPVAADGVPIVMHPRPMDKTRELPACDTCAQDEEHAAGSAPATPKEILDDEVTVPVQSSIESTLTYEMLRRQSTEADEDEEKS
jgi:hypothetical protein